MFFPILGIFQVFFHEFNLLLKYKILNFYSSFKFILTIILFTQLWLCWFFVAVCRLSLAFRAGPTLQLGCTDFSLRWLPLLQSPSSRAHGLQQWWRGGSAVAAPALYSTGSIVWPTGLAAPRHVGSSQTRDQTCVSCIDRQILYL